jgi:hypothetical protein
MRPATLALVLLASSACIASHDRRATSAGRVDRGPYVWHGDGEDPAIDVVNGLLGAAWVAATQQEPPPATLCTSEDPPHTCPDKAGPEGNR